MEKHKADQVTPAPQIFRDDICAACPGLQLTEREWTELYAAEVRANKQIESERPNPQQILKTVLRAVIPDDHLRGIGWAELAGDPDGELVKDPDDDWLQRLVAASRAHSLSAVEVARRLAFLGQSATASENERMAEQFQRIVSAPGGPSFIAIANASNEQLMRKEDADKFGDLVTGLSEILLRASMGKPEIRGLIADEYILLGDESTWLARRERAHKQLQALDRIVLAEDYGTYQARIEKVSDTLSDIDVEEHLAHGWNLLEIMRRLRFVVKPKKKEKPDGTVVRKDIEVIGADGRTSENVLQCGERLFDLLQEPRLWQPRTHPPKGDGTPPKNYSRRPTLKNLAMTLYQVMETMRRMSFVLKIKPDGTVAKEDVENIKVIGAGGRTSENVLQCGEKLFDLLRDDKELWTWEDPPTLKGLAMTLRFEYNADGEPYAGRDKKDKDHTRSRTKKPKLREPDALFELRNKVTLGKDLKAAQKWEEENLAGYQTLVPRGVTAGKPPNVNSLLCTCGHLKHERLCGQPVKTSTCDCDRFDPDWPNRDLRYYPRRRTRAIAQAAKK